MLTKQREIEYVVPEDVLTVEEESKLMQIRDGHREDYFWVGSLANKKIRKAAKAEFPITAKEIYHQIGRILGKSDRTIRYYADVESSYPRWVQEEYDILPFSFFDYARAKDNWKEILDYAMEHPSYSLSAIERKFGVSASGKPAKTAGSDEGSGKSCQKKAVIIHSLINTISDLCDNLRDLAQELEDDSLQGKADKLSSDLREFMAGLVDTNPKYM